MVYVTPRGGAGPTTTAKDDATEFIDANGSLRIAAAVPNAGVQRLRQDLVSRLARNVAVTSTMDATLKAAAAVMKNVTSFGALQDMLPRPRRRIESQQQSQRLRLMLISYPRKWPTAFYIHALALAGFDVSVVAAEGENSLLLAQKSGLVSCVYVCKLHLTALCLAQAMAYCGPSHILALSDVATATMLTLAEILAPAVHARAGEAVLPTALVPIRDALLASLPTQRTLWYVLLDKDALVRDVAHATLGAPIPPHMPLTLQDVQGNPQSLRKGNVTLWYPLILKATRGVAGQGVRIVEDADSLLKRYNSLYQQSSSNSDGPRKLDGAVEGVVSIHAEQYFGSHLPAMLSIVAFKGRVVAMSAWWKNMTQGDAGPSQANCVMIPTQSMLSSATSLMAILGYTGFAGLDYVLDAGGEAYLIDVNPRINPGSLHGLERHGIIPLDLPKAFAVALKDPHDSRLGLHFPDREVLAAAAPIFLKWEYRTMPMLLDRLRDKWGSSKDKHLEFTHAPWCDVGMRAEMARLYNITMDTSAKGECTISVQEENSMRILAVVDHTPCTRCVDRLEAAGIALISSLGKS